MNILPVKPKQSSRIGDKHLDIGQTKQSNNKQNKMGEPVLLNPNSYENIDRILQSLKENLNIGSERHWTFIGCDGPPYSLASRLIERYPKICDRACMLSGLGHLGMNEVKTFFKILDKILLEPLGKKVLHFESQKAYSYFIECKDTHKSWQSFENVLHGTIIELKKLYLDSQHTEISVINFLKWQAGVTNANLKLLTQLFLNYGLAIYVQRIGDRNNNVKMSNAGRYNFLKFIICIQTSYLSGSRVPRATQ